MYIYESCTGFLYATEEDQNYEDTICSVCMNSDSFIGYAQTKEEAFSMLNEIGYSTDSIYDFVQVYFDK